MKASPRRRARELAMQGVYQWIYTGGAPAEVLKNWRGRILTSEDPCAVHRSLEDAFDDFAWSAAA